MNAIAKNIRVVAAAAIFALGAAAVPAGAHHSFTAEFDEKKKVELKGKITEMKWGNPHAWIYIDVKGADGKTVNWALETGNANTLIRNGWKKEDLPVGAVVTASGWQARDGSPKANVNTVTLPNGQRLFAGTSNSNAQQGPTP